MPTHDVVLRGRETVSQAANAAAGSLQTLAGKVAFAANAFRSMEGVSQVLRKVATAVAECVTAWREQERATVVFNAAIESSGRFTAAASSRLREFADSMASITGDNRQTIQSLESFLATAGRTEAQVKRIITVAADMSIATGQDLDGAVRTLNKSFGGLAGELGEAIPEIKSLTAEQLKAGGAVEFLGERYKGLGKALADTVDVKLKNFRNSLANLKAEIGEGSANLFGPMLGWLEAIMTGWVENTKAVKAYAKAQQSFSKAEITEAISLLEIQLSKNENEKNKRKEEYNKTVSAGVANPNDFIIIQSYDETADKIRTEINKLSARLRELSTYSWFDTPTEVGKLTAPSNGAGNGSEVGSGGEAGARTGVFAAYDRLAEFQAEYEKQLRKVAFYGEDSSQAVSRLKDDLYEFSELTRTLDLGPAGETLKQNIEVMLNAALNDASTKVAGDQERAAAEAERSIQVRAATQELLGVLNNNATAAELQRLGQIIPRLAEAPLSSTGNVNLTRFSNTDYGAALGEAFREKLFSFPAGILDKIGNSRFAAGIGEVREKVGGALDVGGGFLQGLFEPIKPLLASIGSFLGPLTNVQALLNPMSTLLSGLMEVIGPLINSALAPLVGMLKIVGKTLGFILQPIIEALGKAIAWVMKGILAVWNGIVDAINWALGWLGVKLKHATFADTVSEGTATTMTTPTTGASASYTKQRDITMYFDIHTTALVGDDGFRQFCLVVGRELRSAGVLGMA